MNSRFWPRKDWNLPETENVKQFVFQVTNYENIGTLIISNGLILKNQVLKFDHLNHRIYHGQGYMRKSTKFI